LGIGYDFVGKENKYSEVFLIEPLLLDESLGDYYLRTKITYVVRGMTLINEAYKQSIYKFGLSI
jgi:hypothetical protein